MSTSACNISTSTAYLRSTFTALSRSGARSVPAFDSWNATAPSKLSHSRIAALLEGLVSKDREPALLSRQVKALEASRVRSRKDSSRPFDLDQAHRASMRQDAMPLDTTRRLALVLSFRLAGRSGVERFLPHSSRIGAAAAAPHPNGGYYGQIGFAWLFHSQLCQGLGERTGGPRAGCAQAD